MASIDKRSDGRYRARWREYPGGPQKTRQFDRKADAERFLDGVRGDLARGVYIDPSDGKTLFQPYAEQWRAGQLHRPSTAAQTEAYLRVHAYPFSDIVPSVGCGAARSRRGSRTAAACSPPDLSRCSTGGWRRSSRQRSATG